VSGAAPAIGLAGFGRLARDYYLPALRALGAVDRLAVADPAPAARAEARARVPSAALYEDPREMLEAHRPDGLLVASPPSTHLALWRAAAARGIPVFMEKPFLLPHELDAIDPHDPAWARLMLDFNRRFWPPYRWLRDAVLSGRVGRVLRARLTLCVDVRPWSRASDHRSLPAEGGALHDLGSQLLDLAATLLGAAPTRLRAAHADPAEARGRARIDLVFPSGASAALELGYTERTQECVWIEGERGRLYLDDPNYLPHRERRGARAVQRPLDWAALGWRGAFRSRSMLRYTVRAALAAFLSALRDGRGFEPGFDDALRVARWLAAAERSLASGAEQVLA
jgi:predicted dehydrogenase